VKIAELFDQHVKLPKEGRALISTPVRRSCYRLAGTGGSRLKFLYRRSHDAPELARAKAVAARAPVQFQQGSLTSLELEDDQFDLALADGPGGAGAGTLCFRVNSRGPPEPRWPWPDPSRFGSSSIYWEALHTGFIDQELEVERLITELPTISQVEEIARCEGLADVVSWTQIEEFDYDSAEAFTRSPLISDFLMKGWLQGVPEEFRQRVIQQIENLIDEERHSGEFSLTVKATLVMGRKVDLPLAG
jgi:hypothetical protein